MKVQHCYNHIRSRTCTVRWGTWRMLRWVYFIYLFYTKLLYVIKMRYWFMYYELSYVWDLILSHIWDVSGFVFNFECDTKGHCLTPQINNLPKLLCSEIAATELTKPLSIRMLYSTKPQTNWPNRSSIILEQAHQVWRQSNHVLASKSQVGWWQVRSH